MTDFLLLAFIFLCAGVVAVPIASRLGLGSVLGYLIAGIVISPILAVLGVDVISIQHFAEFGVVMMLFLVGLELEPEKLWQMRSKLLGLGGGQVGITTVAVMGIAILLGLPWMQALAVELDRHCFANTERKGPNAVRRWAIQFFRSAVSRYRRHPNVGTAAIARNARVGRSCQRCRTW
jgi:predicted Kef-type K+ transport protein